MDSKEDFGDLDVICLPTKEFNVDVLKYWFQTDLVKHNGDCWSLVFGELQIDLIVSNDAEFDFCCNYHGVFDRGNFVGKLAHQLGLKFGHDGLWMPIRLSNSHKLGDVLLTQNPREAEAFLDVKPMTNAKYEEDVFKNVSASKYFNPEVYALENNNAIARVRDKKRPSYRKMLEWCDSLPKQKWFPRSKDKEQYLLMIFEAFPDAEKEYLNLYADYHMIECVNKKFNGDIVREITGLNDKDLGYFMREFKSQHTYDEIFTLSCEEIKQLVLNFRS